MSWLKKAQGIIQKEEIAHREKKRCAIEQMFALGLDLNLALEAREVFAHIRLSKNNPENFDHTLKCILGGYMGIYALCTVKSLGELNDFDDKFIFRPNKIGKRSLSPREQELGAFVLLNLEKYDEFLGLVEGCTSTLRQALINKGQTR